MLINVHWVDKGISSSAIVCACLVYYGRIVKCVVEWNGGAVCIAENALPPLAVAFGIMSWNFS